MVDEAFVTHVPKHPQRLVVPALKTTITVPS